MQFVLIENQLNLCINNRKINNTLKISYINNYLLPIINIPSYT